MMSDLVTSACPSCGARLPFSPQDREATCDYCGIMHLVDLSQGGYLLRQRFHEISTSASAIRSQIALPTLSREIADIRSRLLDLKSNRAHSITQAQDEVKRALFATNGTLGLLFLAFSVAMCFIDDDIPYVIFSRFVYGKDIPFDLSVMVTLSLVAGGIYFIARGVSAHRFKQAKQKQLRVLEHDWAKRITELEALLSRKLAEYEKLSDEAERSQ